MFLAATSSSIFWLAALKMFNSSVVATSVQSIRMHTHGNKECIKGSGYPVTPSQSDFARGQPSQSAGVSIPEPLFASDFEVETAGFDFHFSVDPSSPELWSLYQFWGKLPILELGTPLSQNFFSSNWSWGFCIFLVICGGLAFRCGGFLLFDSCPWCSSP